MDLDPFDDIVPERAATNARAGGKFRPKAKPRPKKESSVQAFNSADNGSSDPSLANSAETEKQEKNVSGIHSSNDSIIVNSSLENVIAETVGHNVVMHPDNVVPDSITGKSAGESGDIFFGLESLDDFYTQSTTETVRAGNGSQGKVSLSVQLGTQFLTSIPVNKDKEGCLASSGISAVSVSETKNKEEGPSITVVSPPDDSAVMVSNASELNTCPEVTIGQDPFTCGGDVLSNSDSGFDNDNRMLEIEEADTIPCLETLDSHYDLTIQSGQRSQKFQPKPKVHFDGDRTGGSTPHPDGIQSIPCFEEEHPIGSENEYMNEGSIPLDSALDFPSLRFCDSIPELSLNEEPADFVDTSLSEAPVPGEFQEAVPEIAEENAKFKRRTTSMVSDGSLEHQKTSLSGQEAEAGRSTRQLRRRVNSYKLVDESEDEDHSDGNLTDQYSGSCHINEVDNDSSECHVANEVHNKRAQRKSNKAAPEKQKPVRKRKKVNEGPDKATEKPPKKFSHSTQRKRRQVDKVLLETPEDEIDVRKLRIKDLILLAEHRERMASKDGKTSEAPSTNQSAGDTFLDNNEGDYFASEQGGDSSNDRENPPAQESSSYVNYHSFMNKTPRSRWTKQDTELFYEGVRQFGSDISMIQQLFPGRTRTQVKLKYKKEERQYPFRLHEALTSRSNDHSHFQLVIERLQQIAAQEKQNSYRDDSLGLTGDEEDLHPEINEEVAKPEQGKEEVKPTEPDEPVEPDACEIRSPVKSYNSEDDLSRWDQYTSVF